MSAHASHAFSIALCTDSEDLPVVSLKVPPNYRLCHRPTRSVRRSVIATAGWSVESSVNCRDGWLWVVCRVMSVMGHNYVMIDSKFKRGDEIKGCS